LFQSDTDLHFFLQILFVLLSIITKNRRIGGLLAVMGSVRETPQQMGFHYSCWGVPLCGKISVIIFLLQPSEADKRKNSTDDANDKINNSAHGLPPSPLNLLYVVPV
jgi:hypothetical protein